jgi:hypothetical protein
MSKRRAQAGTSAQESGAGAVEDEIAHVNHLLNTIPVLRATYLAAVKTLGHYCFAEKDDDTAYNTHDYAVAFNRVMDTGRTLNAANLQLETAYKLIAKRKQEGFRQILNPISSPQQLMQME